MMTKGWKGDKNRHKIASRGSNVRRKISKTGMSKPRMTYYGGKAIKVPPGQNVYLGRTVKDTPPEGFSNLREVRDVLDKIERDYMRVVIDRKTFNARLMRLVGIVRRTKRGELGEAKNKRTAIAMINRMRKRWNFKPVLNKAKKYPTKKQIRASKRNIKKAQQSFRK